MTINVILFLVLYVTNIIYRSMMSTITLICNVHCYSQTMHDHIKLRTMHYSGISRLTYSYLGT